MPENISVEICVDTIDGVRAARNGGATRVELCAALSEGGLTPSAGLMRAAAREAIPCYAMIRPRAGLFQFSPAEEAVLRADIAMAREAGLAGVVLGAQGPDGRLDMAMLARLTAAAGGMGTTLHRVVDVLPDLLEGVDQAVALGFERVLTSGGAAEAPEGSAQIAAMVTRAAGRLSIMAGCGLTSGNVAALVRETGVREVHAACAAALGGERAFSDFDPVGGRKVTDAAEVRAMVDALTE